MQLADTRFVHIDGTRVALLAADEREARIALKELRHKKRELLHYKRRLRRRSKAIDARDKRQARVGTSPGMSPFAYVARSVGAVVHLATGWNPFPGAPLPTSNAAVREDLDTLAEVLLNVDAAILHIEGKLVGS
ncbi:MAG: hypothetical protein ACR2PI_01180 [Hyphomicrobiaceae bacterium]